MKILVFLLLLSMPLFAQRTTNFSLPKFYPHTVLAAGDTADASTANTGLNSVVLRVDSLAMLKAQFVTASKTYDCGSIAAGVDSTFKIPNVGALAGNPTFLGISVASEPGLIITAECTVNDTVRVKISNHFLVSAVDPASRVFKVTVYNP